MRELVMAMFTLPLHVTLCGMRQFVSAFIPCDHPEMMGERLSAFHSSGLGTEESLNAVARRPMGNLNKGILEGLLSLFTPREFWLESLRQLPFDVLEQTAAILCLLLPGQGRGLAWQEFKNKLQCFKVFEGVQVTSRRPVNQSKSLTELVTAARALGPYWALWATEGLGYEHAERSWQRGRRPQDLLGEKNVRGVPTGSLAPLHAGMGLAFAHRVLKPVTPWSRPADIRKVLQEFLALCWGNATEGYAEAAIEGLGLVTRNLYPHVVVLVDRQLWDIDRDLVGYFWHGVGRALYFSPTNCVPCACWTWQGLEKARREAPHELGRRNAEAGLIWALTLVNIRHPEVLEMFLARHGDRLEDDAFANGLSSAAMIWHHWAAPTPYLGTLCRHEPNPSRSVLVERWQKLVREPCVTALQRYYPVLRQQNWFGKIFRYQSLEELLGHH
jgi:hypothetical protein